MANPPERNVVVVPASRRSVKQRCGVLAARIVSNVTRVVPLPVGYWLCDQLGDLLFWRSRLYRLNVIDNLRHVYGPELGERELRRHARGVFRTSARNFWDLTRAPHLDEDELRRIIRYPDHALSLLDRLRDEGKGGILITGHLGPFDFVGQALYLGGYNPFILTAPTVGEFVYAAVNELRHSHGAPLEDISPAAIRRMMRHVLRGGFAGFLMDRDFTDMGETVTFFGAETTLPTGAVKLARASGAPIVPLFVQRDDADRRQRYALRLWDPIYIERTDDEQADVGRGLARVAGLLEHGIRTAPDQWVMFQRVWPDTPRRRRAPFTARRRAAATGAASSASISLANPAPPEPSAPPASDPARNSVSGS